MRIWITALADLSQDSGPTAHLRAQVEGFRARGHEVTAFVSGPSPKGSGFDDPALVFVPRPALPLPRLRYASQLLGFQIALLARLLERVLRGGRPDVLLARHDVGQLAPVLAARLLRIPLVSEINGSLRYELSVAGRGPRAIAAVEVLERLAYRASRRVVAVSEGIAEHLSAELGVEPGRVRVCPNGTNVEAIASGRGDAVRARLGAAPGDLVIGYVGGFQPHQGVRELVEAFARLAERDPRLHLLMVGDGPCAHEVASRMEGSPWAARAVWLGARPRHEVPDCLAAMDVCTAPRFDPRADRRRSSPVGSPLKMFEALAAGRPLVAGPLPDLRLVEKLGAGVCVDSSDPAALADAIEALCRDPERRRRMGQAGRRWALEHGSWQAALDRVEAVLREAIAS